jgi:AcrR family transcriptional regulator
MEATPKAGGRTPRGQGELLRERLIDAALAILDEGHEPSEISIRGVTRRAGVSPTAFYLHFDDREELMRALVERGFTDFRRWIRAGAGRGADPQQRLMNAGAAYIAFSREQPERYRLIFAADLDAEGLVSESDEKPEVAEAAFDDLVELITEYLGDAHPPDNMETLAVGIWSGLHGYATLCHTRPSMAVLTDEQALTDEQYTALLASAWLDPPPGR